MLCVDVDVGRWYMVTCIVCLYIRYSYLDRISIDTLYMQIEHYTHDMTVPVNWPSLKADVNFLCENYHEVGIFTNFH